MHGIAALLVILFPLAGYAQTSEARRTTGPLPATRKASANPIALPTESQVAGWIKVWQK